MPDATFIRSIRIRNLLSFGPESEEIELRPLNVLIGPNGSGKSNLIEVVGLLAAAPSDLAEPLRSGGGTREWLWKGADGTDIAEIEYAASLGERFADLPGVRHRLRLRLTDRGPVVVEEVIEDDYLGTTEGCGELPAVYSWPVARGEAEVRVPVRDDEQVPPAPRDIPYREVRIPSDELGPGSVLSHLRDPRRYPEITALQDDLKKVQEVALHRDWRFGPDAPPRWAQPTDRRADHVLDGAPNLALVINELQGRGGMPRSIEAELARFLEGAERIGVSVTGGAMQLYVKEAGLREPVPATRLSDGTLRYLYLLAILCHPEPPPLICLEEPELGLHPDILSTVAELLVEASQRTQLIVTTHSDILVSALTEEAGSVLVCERDDAGTHMRRLDAERLKKWLEDYSLGELWLDGELGGTRW